MARNCDSTPVTSSLSPGTRSPASDHTGRCSNSSRPPEEHVMGIRTEEMKGVVAQQQLCYGIGHSRRQAQNLLPKVRSPSSATTNWVLPISRQQGNTLKNLPLFQGGDS